MGNVLFHERNNNGQYRSDEPIEVYIDTVYDNEVTVPSLPDSLGCFGNFSTYWQEMEWKNGVLIIKGKGNPKTGKNPYVVTLM